MEYLSASTGSQPETISKVASTSVVLSLSERTTSGWMWNMRPSKLAG